MLAFRTMIIHHLIAGARERETLVRDDRDRCELLWRVARALDGPILAYCVMDTHLHLVAASPPDPLERALFAYVRRFNRRHGRSGPLLRGPVAAFEKRERAEIVRAIRYAHANPLKTSRPLVERALEFPWSGEREIVGLSCAGIIAIEPLRAIAGFLPLLSPAPALAGAEPRRIPTADPATVVGAAAQAFALDPAALASGKRTGPEAAARALAVALCLREGHKLYQVAPFLGITRRHAGRLGGGVPETAIRVARTLLDDPRLRARIVAAEAPIEVALA